MDKISPNFDQSFVRKLYFGGFGIQSTRISWWFLILIPCNNRILRVQCRRSHRDLNFGLKIIPKGQHFIDFWSNLGRHWVDTRSTLGRHCVDIGSTLDQIPKVALRIDLPLAIGFQDRFTARGAPRSHRQCGANDVRIESPLANGSQNRFTARGASRSTPPPRLPVDTLCGLLFSPLLEPSSKTLLGNYY